MSNILSKRLHKNKIRVSTFSELYRVGAGGEKVKKNGHMAVSFTQPVDTI